MEHPKLSQQEQELFDKIQAKTLEEVHEKAPGTQVYKLFDQIWHKYYQQRWNLESEKKFISMKPEDIPKISEVYGPDLTSIPRKRYNFGKKAKVEKSTEKTYSPYNQFVKEMMAKPEIQALPNQNDRMKEVGRLWKLKKSNEANE